jgi:hypothetical protein
MIIIISDYVGISANEDKDEQMIIFWDDVKSKCWLV